MATRTITVEEHYRAKGYSDYLRSASVQGFNAQNAGANRLQTVLEDLGEIRLHDMDAAGIDVQVIAQQIPHLPLSLPGDQAVSLARQANDQLGAAVAAHPDRFAGFAALPMTEPRAAADELERAVRTLGLRGTMILGTTRGLFLDHPSFFPILERAAALDVPIYIHPALPPQGVLDAYYSGFEGAVGSSLAGSAWGWHQEVGVHVLRLVVAGVFDKLPNLQIMIGHLGEMIPFMFDRIDERLTAAAGNLKKPVGAYLRQNVLVTVGGFFYEPVFKLAMERFGADRMLFSVDYPFMKNEDGRAFLNRLSLGSEDMEKFCHLNAERILKLPKA